MDAVAQTLFWENLDIFAAYTVIGAEILYFYQAGMPIFRGRTARYLFAIFIPACGITHLVTACNVWLGLCHPTGAAAGAAIAADTVTALVSTLTAMLLPSVAHDVTTEWQREREALVADVRKAFQRKFPDGATG